jgi:hypothetical protein
MNHVRSFLLLGFTALLFELGSAWAARLADLDRQWGKLAELPGFFYHEQQRKEQLGRLQEALHHRAARKDEILHDLLDGRMTLAEAAARFRQAEIDYPTSKKLPPAYESRAEGEYRCRQVISCLRNRLRGGELGAGAAQTIHRLEDELAGQLYCNGTVELPEVN